MYKEKLKESPGEEDGDDDLDGDHGDGEHGDLLLGNLPLDQLEARHAWRRSCRSSQGWSSMIFKNDDVLKVGPTWLSRVRFFKTWLKMTVMDQYLQWQKRQSPWSWAEPPLSGWVGAWKNIVIKNGTRHRDTGSKEKFYPSIWLNWPHNTFTLVN